VDVDEPGRNHLAGGVNRGRGLFLDGADLHDLVVGDTDVGAPPGRSRPVDDLSALDDDVQHGALLSTLARLTRPRPAIH
jgi:hypothetical protein